MQHEICAKFTHWKKQDLTNPSKYCTLGESQRSTYPANMICVPEDVVPEAVYLNIPRVLWMSSFSYCFLDEGPEHLFFAVNRSLRLLLMVLVLEIAVGGETFLWYAVVVLCKVGFLRL